MQVLLAPDKFKGSLTATQVADALALGLSGHSCRHVPIADGGDGTVAAFIAAGWDEIACVAPGPTGRSVSTTYARRDGTAVVELASVCGLAQLPGGVPDPLGSGTRGLGVVIAHALDAGANEIIIGLGGSASTDGGAGMLTALGARVTDVAGLELRPGGEALAAAEQLDLSSLHPGVARASFVLACDVDNPLLGPSGAAAIYAPQKGASEIDVVRLEAAMRNWARVVARAVRSDAVEHLEAAGAGAAGGTAFAAMAVLGAQRRSGIDVVLESIGFAHQLAGADLVITGEGSLDKQSLSGKAPMGVVAAARAAGVPVVAVAGRCELDEAELADAGFSACYCLADIDPERCMTAAPALLEQVGRVIAKG